MAASSFPLFTDVVLAEFEDAQVDAFIHNWFRQDPAGARELTRRLSQQEAIRELAGTPLLLAFICAVFQHTQSLPANRATLYEEAFNILFYRWNAEKCVHKDEAALDLERDVEKRLLAQIAADAYERKRVFFTRAELLEQIGTYTTTLMQPPRLTAEGILTAIQEEQGLLVERAHDLYSFSHRTVQEYLTAWHWFGSGRAPLLIKERLFDEWWREVILLLAGMLDVNELLLQMARQGQDHVQSEPSVMAAVEWATRRAEGQGEPASGLRRRLAAFGQLVGVLRMRGAEHTARRAEKGGASLVDLLDDSLGPSATALSGIVEELGGASELDAREVSLPADMQCVLDYQDPKPDRVRHVMAVERAKAMLRALRDAVSIARGLGLDQVTDALLSQLHGGSKEGRWARVVKEFGIPEVLVRDDEQGAAPRALESYLAAQKRILECRRAGGRSVTRATWTTLCNSLLSPRDTVRS